MKKIFTLLTALLCTVAQVTWAECYVLEEASEEIAIGAYSNSSGVSYSLNGYGDLLSVNLRKARAATQSVEIYGYTANGSEKHLKSVGVSDLSTSHTLFEIGIDTSIVSIKIKAGGTLNKYFKDLKVRRATFANQPASPHIDFGKAKVKSTDATISTTMSWCNVNPFSYTIDGDKDQFSVSIENNASTCAQGTATVTVTYAHNVVGEHSATLTLSNGTFTHTITLSGVTEKKDQFIVWSKDIENNKLTLPVGKEMSNAATATSELAVTYTSSDENVVAITNGGTSFKAVGAGTAVITATQAGNDTEWNAASDFITVTVTEKKIQYIQWTDNLSRLLVGDTPLTLTAKVQTVDAEGTRTDAPERDQYLTYTSGDANVVTVKGNVLTIVGEGTTTLTASVSGDDNYEEATATMSVRVRTASAGCEDVLVDGNLTGGEVEFFQYNTNKIEKTYAISRSNGVPNKLSFDHKGGRWGLNYGGNIEVRESTDGGNTWSSVLWSQEPTAGTYNNSGEIQLSRNATHVKFTRPNGGTGYHYIKDVVITPAQYLESAQAAIAVDKSIIGDKIERELVINYSNVKAELLVSHNDIKNVSVNEQYLGNKCGAFGSATLHITIVPTAVGTLLDTIRVKDEVSGMVVVVPVEVKTQRNTQTITWEDVPSSILTTDTITLKASAQTTITYSTSDSAIAYVNEENKLVIMQAGEVSITATAAQDDKYEEATLSKTITIELAEQAIVWDFTTTIISVSDELVLDATATSGYAVIYELEPTDIATLDGNTLTAVAVGTLTITAQQYGMDEQGYPKYKPAVPVSFIITIASSSTGNGLVITEVHARKTIRNGEVVIIRGEEVYNLRGQRVE